MNRKRFLSGLWLVGLSLTLAGGVALARDTAASAGPAAPASFGPYTSILSIPADAFSPASSGTSYSYDISTFARYRSGGADPWFNAPLNLPSGAHIDGISFELYDNDAAYEISSWLATNIGSVAGTNTIFNNVGSTSGTPGWVYVTNTMNVTVDNLNNSYFLQVSMSSDAGQQKLRRAMVYYHLQVSPAPGTATFGDVPTSSPQFQYVEALVAAGITAGCGGGNYCPTAPLTRGQMAVFLSKLLGLYWPN